MGTCRYLAALQECILTPRSSHACRTGPRRILETLRHWLNLKNCRTVEIGLVTVFWPLTTNGTKRLGVQIELGPKLVVACKVKPVAAVGQDRTTIWPDGVIVSCGGRTG